MFSITSRGDLIKVIDEGDSLQIGSIIHSFYWDYDGFDSNQDDFEPVALHQPTETCLTRYHYRCLVLWKGNNVTDDQLLISFFPGWHTPLICKSIRPISYVLPRDDMDRAFVLLFIQYLKTRRVLDLTNYNTPTNYTLISENVPENRKFKLEGFTSYIIIGTTENIEDINIPDQIRTEIIRIRIQSNPI